MPFLFRRLHPVLLFVFAIGAPPRPSAAQATKRPAPAVSSSAQQAIKQVENGRCKEALPVLKRSLPRITDKDLRYHTAMALTRCAMGMQNDQAGAGSLVVLEREYPDPGSLQRLRVHITDRPGVLAGITQALGAERINIEDFELHHVSPERGGTLTLLVEGEGEAQRAATLLESQGYSVVISAVIDAG